MSLSDLASLGSFVAVLISLIFVDRLIAALRS
jgi:hypothetical protein